MPTQTELIKMTFSARKQQASQPYDARNCFAACGLRWLRCKRLGLRTLRRILESLSLVKAVRSLRLEVVANLTKQGVRGTVRNTLSPLILGETQQISAICLAQFKRSFIQAQQTTWCMLDKKINPLISMTEIQVSKGRNVGFSDCRLPLHGSR